MKKNYLFILLAAIFLCACSKYETKDMTADNPTKTNTSTLKAASAMVILHQANLAFDYVGGVKVVGFIKVKNVSYQKQVTVRYHIDNGSWIDVNASYYAPLNNGEEIWRFETATFKWSRYYMPVFEYAIRYIVNGSEYWDNNSGKNYKMYASIGTEYSHEFLIGGETMVSGKIQLQGSSTSGYSLAFWAYVQDIAYQKEVNWSTLPIIGLHRKQLLLITRQTTPHNQM